MKPTCCFPLRAGMKFIAILDFVISLGAVVGSIGAFLYFELMNDDVLKWFDNPPPEVQFFINLQRVGGRTVTRLLLGFSVAYWLQKMFLAILLLIGTFQEKRSLLRVWIVYTLILLVFSVIAFLGVIGLGVAEPYSIPFYVVAFLLREYTIWAVYAFLKRLQFGKEHFHSSFPGDKVICKL